MQFFKQLETYNEHPLHHAFQLGHLIWLLVLFLGIIGLVKLYMVLAQPARHRLLLWLTGFLMVDRIIVLGSSILVHGFYYQWLPIQICPLMMILAFIYVLKPSRFAGEVLFTIGIFSPMMAIIFPDWLKAPYFNFYSANSFITHAILIAVVLMLVTAGEIKPKIGEIWMPILFVLIGLPLITFANEHLHMNYWMIAKPSVGSPLVGIYNHVGAEFYVPTIVLAEIAIWVLLYTIYAVNPKRTN